MKNYISKISFLVILGIVVSTSCKKPADPAFTASKSPVAIGEAVTFVETDVEQIKNASFVYDFGDGSTSNDNSILSTGIANTRNASHIYAMPGTYKVTQTVYYNNNSAKGKSKQKSVTLDMEVTAVVAGFTASKTTCGVNENIILTNSSTGDDFGYPVTYNWSSVSEGAATAVFAGNTLQDKNQTVRFPNPGKYKVTLIATQGNYITRKTTEINVTNGVVNPDITGSLAAQLIGQWSLTKVEHLYNTVGASCGNIPGTITPITNGSSYTETKTLRTINFIANAGSTTSGRIYVVYTTGTQIPFDAGSWSLDEVNSVTISSTQVGGTWSFAVSGSTLTMNQIDISPSPCNMTENTTAILSK